MIEIGKYNDLKFVKKASAGLYLSDGKDEALLSYSDVPEGIQEGDTLNVFVYLDNENNKLATTKKALGCVGEFALLTVVDDNNFGSYLDWGIAKDLFVPYREQKEPMDIGKQYVVYIFPDRADGRIIGSTKLANFVQVSDYDVKQGDEVQLLIADETDLGYNAIINNKYIGLLYHNEVFETLNPGDERKGYIKLIREDGKIDLTLQLIGYKQILDFKTTLLEKLKANKGSLPLGDKSTPDEILRALKISKKVFKKTVGSLYKERLIEISDYEIKLIPEAKEQAED